jgi:hypothetical protein
VEISTSTNGGKTCVNPGVEGVDLFGGTRHSAVTALRDYFSPKRIPKD